MARLAWVGFIVAAVAHLICQLLDLSVPAGLTQLFLAPLLMGVVVLSGLARTHLRRWMLIALAFSFVGDSLPKLLPQAEVMIMIGGFAIAQICWIVGLWPLRSRSLIVRHRWQLPIYLIVGMGLLVACIPTAGSFGPAVVAYAVILIAMAVLASGLGRIGQWGGISFLVSDTLIAFDRFVPWISVPEPGVLIMATYVLALALLVLAAVSHLQRPGADPAEGGLETAGVGEDTGSSGA